MFVFCPKVGRPRGAARRVMGTCPNNRTTCTLSAHLPAPDACGNPFRGQSVSAVLTPIMPFLWIGGGGGGQDLKGFAIELMRMLSRRLEFDLRVVLARNSEYYAHNQTFSDGNPQKVHAAYPSGIKRTRKESHNVVVNL